MVSNKLLLLGAAAVAYYVYTEKKAIGLLNFYISGVAIDFEGYTPIMKVDLKIQNPSNTSFTVNDFIGNLTANGQDIGTMSSFVPVQVPGASEVTYPIIIRLNPIGIVEDIITLIQQQSGISQTVVLKGVVNANGIVAPVNLNYKISY